jgi:hypothetical protein
MALTGRAEGPPLGPPASLVDLVEGAAAVVADRTAGRVALDGLALLGERAAIEGLRRNGSTSCGGGTRLLPARDGWLAVAFPRDDDVAALPAWLERDVPADDPWPAVIASVARAGAAELDERAGLLGLPVAAMASVGAPTSSTFGLPVVARQHASAPPGHGVENLRVVDLSALWAGPLCGQILACASADVVKVESTTRPDGARRGRAAFFDLLNSEKRSVTVDITSASGRLELLQLVTTADVVIESTRPRALEQLGIVAADLLAGDGPRVWVSITGHGRERADRVAFGDVAAVAGGLVAHDEEGPCFVADAVADPLTGLVAAAAALEALAEGGRWLIDAGMAPISAAAARGEQLDVAGLDAAAPTARP